MTIVHCCCVVTAHEQVSCSSRSELLALVLKKLFEAGFTFDAPPRADPQNLEDITSCLRSKVRVSVHHFSREIRIDQEF